LAARNVGDDPEATMKVLYTAEAVATGGRDGRARTSDGTLDLSLKPPKELGGPGGEATNPEQLLAAGYGACFLNAVSLLARSQKISAKQFSVTTRVDLGQTDDGGFGLQAELHCELPGVEQDQAEALVRRAYDVCPFSKAMRGNIEVPLLVGGRQLEEEVGDTPRPEARVN
jgi:Ohr subfamily peroxiredoxin